MNDRMHTAHRAVTDTSRELIQRAVDYYNSEAFQQAQARSQALAEEWKELRSIAVDVGAAWMCDFVGMPIERFRATLQQYVDRYNYAPKRIDGYQYFQLADGRDDTRSISGEFRTMQRMVLLQAMELSKYVWSEGRLVYGNVHTSMLPVPEGEKERIVRELQIDPYTLSRLRIMHTWCFTVPGADVMKMQETPKQLEPCLYCGLHEPWCECFDTGVDDYKQDATVFQNYIASQMGRP